jgi:hypothetical protein
MKSSMRIIFKVNKDNITSADMCNIILQEREYHTS